MQQCAMGAESPQVSQSTGPAGSASSAACRSMSPCNKVLKGKKNQQTLQSRACFPDWTFESKRCATTTILHFLFVSPQYFSTFRRMFIFTRRPLLIVTVLVVELFFVVGFAGGENTKKFDGLVMGRAHRKVAVVNKSDGGWSTKIYVPYIFHHKLSLYADYSLLFQKRSAEASCSPYRIQHPSAIGCFHEAWFDLWAKLIIALVIVTPDNGFNMG